MENKTYFLKTILIVDDEVINLDILGEILSEYDVIDTTNSNDIFKIIEKEKIDLILLDIIMPNTNGFEVCKELKNNPKTKHIPIIFITANSDENSIEEAYNVGGNDYIIKPFKQKEVLARVRTQLKLKDLIEHLEFISYYDQLSGLYNRRKFFQLAKDKFDNDKENLYAVIMDLDKFKLINDTYGHDIGDKVIKCFAETINKLLPNDSIFARIGGEEFALIINMPTLELEKFLDYLRLEINSISLEINKDEFIKFTISMGASKYKNSFNTLEELLKDADKGLYEAKDSGRNKSIFRN